MSKELVFVHGRAQENKDSIALKQEWISSFKEGLLANGLTLEAAEEDIRFPYYGDTLHELTQGSINPAEVIIRGDDADAAELEFMRSILEEVRKRAGITEEELRDAVGDEVVRRGPANWEWFQGILKAIDRHVPYGSGASIALVTNDVYQYLRNPAIKSIIEEGVRKAITPGVSTVVVSHSLGTVVAYNLLRQEGAQNGWVVPLFVTLGSPLAVTAIRRGVRPVEHPACVGRWFNAMDERDVVALYPLDKDGFDVDPAIQNKTDVRNHTTNRHGIAGYLGDKEVAKQIYDALKP